MNYNWKINRLCGTNNKKCSIDNLQLPDIPTTCCMSACANCVWIEYANKLSEILGDGGEKSIEIINEKITDPNMKAFLITELKIKNNSSLHV